MPPAVVLAREVVGRGEDLQRAGHVEQLHSGEDEHLDRARRRGWRERKAVWHTGQSLPR